MKQILILLFTLLAPFSTIYAQANKKEGYLFDTFKEGIVRYRDGRQFGVPLNYNLIVHQFEFIDKNDGNQKKEFSDPSMITVIEIDGRTFLPPSEGITEMIQSEPPFYVTYEATVRKERATAFGGQTQTASVDSYSQIRGVGVIGGVDGTKKSVASLNKVYKILIGKKTKRFTNEKQLIKLFPKQKETLVNYLTDKPVDFNNIEQVLKLYNFILNEK